MNDQRRKVLVRAMALIEEAQSIIEKVKGAEEEAYENLPESMQTDEKGSKIQTAIDALSEANDACESAIDYISTASE
jgi:hypothetical protein